MQPSHSTGTHGSEGKKVVLKSHRNSDKLEEAFASFTTKSGHVESWDSRRLGASRALNNTKTDVGLAGLISFNIILVVIETNYAANTEKELPAWMTGLNTAILMVFCSEVVMRVYVERTRFFRSFLNWFDLLVVALDAILTIVRLSMGIKSTIPMMMFRILRLMKILRTVRLMMLFPELNILLRCLAYATKAILWAVLMLLVVLGFWSILAVVLIHPLNLDLAREGYWRRYGCERCPRAFESVQQSMLTFSQQLIAGDSWGTICVPLIERHPITGLFFFAVLISISMAVMNLILAVIVEKASEARETSHREEALKKDQDFLKASEKLFAICKELDNDDSGSLTFEEIMHGFKSNPGFATIMSSMDIGESDLEVVFEILDTDGSHSIDYKEFVDQLHMMKNRESHTLLIFIKFYVMELRQMMKRSMRDGAHGCASSSLVGMWARPQAGNAPRASFKEEAPQPSGGGGEGDATRAISASLQENAAWLDMQLDMQRELSDVLKRHREACNTRMRRLESILAASLEDITITPERTADGDGAGAGQPGPGPAGAGGHRGQASEGPFAAERADQPKVGSDLAQREASRAQVAGIAAPATAAGSPRRSQLASAPPKCFGDNSDVLPV